jgi:photosystem II stability/assembly factor-like uncharacterized protein
MTEEMTTPDIVHALAASPNFAQDGVCFAARQSGLYRSEDSGESWQFAYESLQLEAELVTAAVAVSPNFVEDRHVFAGVSGGILRSIDGGKNWSVATLPSPPPFVTSLVISPNYRRDGIIFAATLEDGVFYSKDGGANWVSWNFGLLDLSVLALVVSPDFANDETLFVGTDSGIYRSTNGGRAWRETDFLMDNAPVLSLAMSPNYVTDKTLFAGTEESGLFRSEDGGQSWAALNQDVETVNSILLSPEFPAKPDILMMLDESLLVSRDGGQTWEVWPVALPDGEGMASIIAPQGLDTGSPLLLGLVEGIVQKI